mmetsp:Transcript_40274/g.87157  ORF Transcript_40274/g.87157 Transcript_40274/m.87157 type:complete len:220 (-) Transcript_40274:683-1342(-)
MISFSLPLYPNAQRILFLHQGLLLANGIRRHPSFLKFWPDNGLEVLVVETHLFGMSLSGKGRDDLLWQQPRSPKLTGHNLNLTPFAPETEQSIEPLKVLVSGSEVMLHDVEALSELGPAHHARAVLAGRLGPDHQQEVLQQHRGSTTPEAELQPGPAKHAQRIDCGTLSHQVDVPLSGDSSAMGGVKLPKSVAGGPNSLNGGAATALHWQSTKGAAHLR